MSGNVFDIVLATTSSHASIDRWDDIVNAIAPKYFVPPNLVKAHMLYESGGDPNIVGASGRGLGLMQIDWGTSKNWFGRWFYSGPNGKTYDIFKPEVNILIACRDFIAPNMVAFPHNLDACIAAFNAGIGPVEDAIASGRNLTKVTYDPAYIENVSHAFAWLNGTSHEGVLT